MEEKTRPSMEELKHRRRLSLEKAQKAITAHPREYRLIKRMLEDILANPVDIKEYYRIARSLSMLLEQLNASSPGSLFSYYHENIAPHRQGDTRYFKIICEDLRQQIRQVDQFRRQQHNLRIIQ
jgi:hypothetical protein